MSDIEHYVKRCSELSRENDALQARVAELERVIKSHQGAQFGDESPCYFCGEPVNGLHGNPNLWPLYFCHEDDPGVAKPHHTGCVTDRLTELAAKTAECERLQTERDDAAHETAGMIEFLGVHLNWEDFWAEGFLGKETASLAEKNAQSLRRFLDEKGWGIKAHGSLRTERDTALRDLATAREECERLRGELARRPWVDPDEDKPVEPTWEEEATLEEINAQQMLDHGLTYFDKP